MAEPHWRTLYNARVLIVTEDRWAARQGAEDAMGAACDPLDDEAVRWCATGAVQHVAGQNTGRPVLYPLRFLDNAAWWLFSSTIRLVNDHEGHEAVLRCFDRAIDEAHGRKK